MIISPNTQFEGDKACCLFGPAVNIKKLGLLSEEVTLEVTLINPPVYLIDQVFDELALNLSFNRRPFMLNLSKLSGRKFVTDIIMIKPRLNRVVVICLPFC